MSVGIIETHEKQPAEKKRLFFDYRAWLIDQGNDTISTAVVTAEDGITISGTSHAGGIVTYFAAGGTDGVKYTVTCTVTTAAGAIEEANSQIKVKETS